MSKNTLKSALEAAGIKPIAKSNLDLQAAADYVAEYLNEYLGVRVVKNHITMHPVEAQLHGFLEYAAGLSLGHGVHQSDFMDLIVKPAAISLGNELEKLGRYLAFTPASTLFEYPTEFALGQAQNVHVRVAVWDSQTNNYLGCQIGALCLANQ